MTSATTGAVRGSGRTGVRSARVARMSYEGTGILSVEFADPDGGDLGGWEPGEHIDIELVPGLTRQYSLCGRVGDTARWTVAVRAAEPSRGGSHYVHRTLRVGDTVRVSAPRQKFPLEPAPAYVFVAGGIGITPLLPMIETAVATGAAVQVHYAAASRAATVFLDRLAAAGPELHLYPAGGARLDLPAVVAAAGPHTLVYCCGPQRMLDEITALVDRERLRIESFDPAPPSTPPAAEEAVTDAPADSPCAVQFGEDGPIVEVAATESVLDALERSGADVMWSCRTGTCGSCEMPVLRGKVDHRDNILDEHERAAGDCFFPCVSRPKGPEALVVDL